MAIEAVVFDIGRVLVDWNPERFYDARMGRERRERFFAETGVTAMNDEIDRGEPFRETVMAHAARHPDWAEEIAHWHDSWDQMIGPDLPLTGRLLRALKGRGVPVFALSNIGEATYKIAATRYPVLSQFDRAYVSGALRLIKPDPRIYAAVETDSGVAPEALLFTDDRADNIEAAAARGWKTHLFEHPEGLAERLVAEGLLRAEDAA
jgi:2-haloacid dehalogenase